ncbi:MAG: formylglycine-generating enzyme family protein [Bacteroidales bacterium]|jgi:formylglycine-generating enzyme required for sulfatase activity|nr:formylglycine-generating enzyme family protein [Bacteroidales bacterium]
MNRLLRLLLLGLLLMTASVVQGKRYYVGFTNTTSAPGGSVVITKTANLGADLLRVLGPAPSYTLSSGDTVLIAEGKYYLTSELIIPAGVVVQGGYNPDAGTILTRTYPGAEYPSGAPTFANMTILDGNAFFTSSRAKKHRVATVKGTLETCYIRGGHTNELNGTTPEKLYGGGLYVDAGTVVSCIIRGNVANNITSRATTPALGGGVYLINGGKIYNSLIVNNMANRGYGVYGEVGCAITNATVIYNTFAPIGVLVPGTGPNIAEDSANTTNYYYHQEHAIGYSDANYNTTVKVQLTDFYLGATETTCLQYCVFLAGVDYRVEYNNIILADTYRDSLWTLKVYGTGASKTVREYYGTDIRADDQSDEDYCANGYHLCYTNPNSDVSNPWYFGFLYQNSGIIVPKERTGAGTIPDDDISVCYVSWYGSMAYCQWLGGSLPTEAQWEFALRRKNASPFVAPDPNDTTIAGQSSSLHNYAFAYPGYVSGEPTDIIKNYAWFYPISNDASTAAAYGVSDIHNHKVGEKEPTGLGLYDMNGNLSEWCADLYPGTSSYEISHYDYPSGNDMISGDVMLNPINNAVGASSPPSRSFCGGSWDLDETDLRAGHRWESSADYFIMYGFRPAFLSPFAP